MALSYLRMEPSLLAVRAQLHVDFAMVRRLSYYDLVVLLLVVDRVPFLAQKAFLNDLGVADAVRKNV